MRNECAIKVGEMVLDNKQQKHLLSAVIKFNQIPEKYQLDSGLFEYSETIHFMRKCRELFIKRNMKKTTPFKAPSAFEKELIDFSNKYRVLLADHSKKVGDYFGMTYYNFVI